MGVRLAAQQNVPHLSREAKNSPKAANLPPNPFFFECFVSSVSLPLFIHDHIFFVLSLLSPS